MEFITRLLIVPTPRHRTLEAIDEEVARLRERPLAVIEEELRIPEGALELPQRRAGYSKNGKYYRKSTAAQRKRRRDRADQLLERVG